MWAIIYLISNVFLKTEKSDSITAHYKQQFKSTMLFTTELHKCIKLKLVKQINPIGAKPNSALGRDMMMGLTKTGSKGTGDSRFWSEATMARYLFMSLAWGWLLCLLDQLQ